MASFCDEITKSCDVRELTLSTVIHQYGEYPNERQKVDDVDAHIKLLANQ